MEHGTLRNNEKYYDILAVNAGTHIRLILITTRGTAVSCNTQEHKVAVLSCPI